MSYDPHFDLKARKVFLAQADNFGPWNPEAGEDDTTRGDCGHEFAALRYDEGNDKNVCLICLRTQIGDMQYALAGWRP